MIDWTEKYRGAYVQLRDATGKDYRGKLKWADLATVILEDGGGIEMWLRRKTIISVTAPVK